MSRTVLITGGAKGIGFAIAKEFIRDHNVAIVWNTEPPKESLAGVHMIHADLTKEASCKAVVEDVIAHFGRLDVIVNNAGLVQTTPVHNFNADTHRAILDINLLVPSDLLAAALPHLTSGASIVNISSINATMPPKEAAIYGASKTALGRPRKPNDIAPVVRFLSGDDAGFITGEVLTVSGGYKL